jgi:Tfp pilus assembly protein PilZ
MRANLPVEWCERGASVRLRSTAEDLSDDGLFVRTALPLRKGTEVELELRTEIGIFVAAGTVAWATPERGMGIQLRS